MTLDFLYRCYDNAYDLHPNKNIRRLNSHRNSLREKAQQFCCFRDKARHYYFGDNTRIQILDCS